MPGHPKPKMLKSYKAESFGPYWQLQTCNQRALLLARAAEVSHAEDWVP